MIGHGRSIGILGDLQGDRATTAITLNAVPRVVEHLPGLVTMNDLPVVSCFPEVAAPRSRGGCYRARHTPGLLGEGT